jgi:hypothetical protein
MPALAVARASRSYSPGWRMGEGCTAPQGGAIRIPRVVLPNRRAPPVVVPFGGSRFVEHRNRLAAALVGAGHHERPPFCARSRGTVTRMLDHLPTLPWDRRPRDRYRWRMARRAGKRTGESLYDDRLPPEAADEGTRSRRIIFSQSSQVNTSTSGRPLWPGKDSNKRSSFLQYGQVSKALSTIGPELH